MPRLTIDNREVDVPEGGTVLEAAEKLGISIPTLCHVKGCTPETSCLVCVVRIGKGPRLVPSCATKALDGMAVQSETDEIRTARKTALELLLSDHLGDCIAPCQRVCPAHMNIPLMIRQIGQGRLNDAIVTVKKHIPLPAVLGRICNAPCEKACRRGHLDASVSICLLKRFVGDADLAGGSPYMPPCKPRSGKKVAIIGAGPTGLSAAYYLAQEGHECTVFDEHEKAGGMLRYGVKDEELPREVIDREIAVITKLGVQFKAKTVIGRDISMADLRARHDAVVVAAGELDPVKAAALGVEMTGVHVKVNTVTLETGIRGVFAGGEATHHGRMAVRAVAHGRIIAHSIGQLFMGVPAGHHHRFNSTMGKIEADELQEFSKDADRAARIKPAGGRTAGLSRQESVKESARCLHCDCRKVESCRLRSSSDDCGAEQQRFKSGKRRKFEKIIQHSTVVFEPGKCIRCGLCVQITARERERFGLAFVGRGFDVMVTVPMNESLEKGLEKVAADCVRACPTAALSFKTGDEEQSRG